MKKIVLMFFIAVSGLTLSAQTSTERKANKEYGKYNYFDAISVYKKVYDKGYASPEVLLKLANSYYLNADYANAVVFYDELFEMNPDTMNNDIVLLRYSNSLKAMSKYKEADTIMDKFLTSNENAEIVQALSKKAVVYLDEIEKNSGRFEIKNVGFNSHSRDYGVAFYKKDQIVYTSTRDTINTIKRRSGWDGQAYSQLYVHNISDSEKQSKNNKTERLSKVLNSKYHESTPVFTKDGNTVYFTRNNYTDGKLKTDSQKTTLLKIYKSTFDGEKWAEAEELPFNSDDFNCAHPALSVDEKYLYFASDRPGGFGYSDLYKVEINNGNFSQPQNLGNTVNTMGRETFPFISSDNELYFSSDGHLGLGGLDIFVLNINSLEKGNSKPINIGKDINTTFDDFNFIIDATTRKGYFSSNRTNDNVGLDDIYQFTELRKLDNCSQILKGFVTDSLQKTPLARAKLELLNKNHEVINQSTTNEDGSYDFGKVTCGEVLYIKVAKEDYTPKEEICLISRISGETIKNLELAKKKEEYHLGDDLAKTLNIPIIYFDLDKSNIRKDASVELAKVLVVLQENPTMSIDIRSHTDCRASFNYNLQLSERRAQSTREWLISNGISKERLTAKGYGESQLLNNCACEPTSVSPCSEAEHQKNRRSEFIITKI